MCLKLVPGTFYLAMMSEHTHAHKLPYKYDWFVFQVIQTHAMQNTVKCQTERRRNFVFKVFNKTKRKRGIW